MEELATQEVFSSLIFICLVIAMCVVIFRCINAVVSANASFLLSSDEYIESNIIPKETNKKEDNYVNNNNKM